MSWMVRVWQRVLGWSRTEEGADPGSAPDPRAGVVRPTRTEADPRAALEADSAPGHQASPGAPPPPVTSPEPASPPAPPEPAPPVPPPQGPLQVRVYLQDHRMGVQLTGLEPLEARRPRPAAPPSSELWFLASAN